MCWFLVFSFFISPFLSGVQVVPGRQSRQQDPCCSRRPGAVGRRWGSYGQNRAKTTTRPPFCPIFKVERRRLEVYPQRQIFKRQTESPCAATAILLIGEHEKAWPSSRAFMIKSKPSLQPFLQKLMTFVVQYSHVVLLGLKYDITKKEAFLGESVNVWEQRNRGDLPTPSRDLSFHELLNVSS